MKKINKIEVANYSNNNFNNKKKEYKDNNPELELIE
jgi:sulfate adenylyltransferase subunit 1 (EFTu-like GTPase family)